MSQTKAQLISGTSTQDVTFDDATVSSLNGGPIAGARNRIINGDMRIDQRNAGASGTARTYTVDRFVFDASLDTKGTWQQNAGSVTPPSGFSNYLGFTSNSAYSVGAGDYFTFMQPIEGYNIADLAWGTANAKTITISFYARSSLTGTFSGSIRNSAANRSYPFIYTISSANTWEYKTVTIPGDTSGTWLTNNGVGMYVNFSYGSGATYSGTAGSWSASNYVSATGTTSVVGTNGATFYITGVQLEAGTVATPFERRSYGQELSLCQRYYYQHSGGTAGSGSEIGTGAFYNSTSGNVCVHFKVPMRIGPSIVATSGAGYYSWDANSGSYTTSSLSISRSGPNACHVYANFSSAPNGFAASVYTGAGGSLAFSAEL